LALFSQTSEHDRFVDKNAYFKADEIGRNFSFSQVYPAFVSGFEFEIEARIRCRRFKWTSERYNKNKRRGQGDW